MSEIFNVKLLFTAKITKNIMAYNRLFFVEKSYLEAHNETKKRQELCLHNKEV